jgi:hypothetical protein
MLSVSRREYKVMLDHRLFGERKHAAKSFGLELHACAQRLKGIEYEGEFKQTKKREVSFLDTKDHTIQLNRFVLRQRVDMEKEKTEYTLKCRSPDRYLAAGADTSEGDGIQGNVKLEEDIGAPFVVRFSHSNTVKGPEAAPATIEEAARLFPVLSRLRRDGEACSKSLTLRPVNAVRTFERVLQGPMLRFNKTVAEVALILWSDGEDGRPLVAEFSFRYGHGQENYSPKTARKAMEFFEDVQTMDWCLLGARTKTQYVYSS